MYVKKFECFQIFRVYYFLGTCTKKNLSNFNFHVHYIFWNKFQGKTHFNMRQFGPLV